MLHAENLYIDSEILFILTITDNIISNGVILSRFRDNIDIGRVYQPISFFRFAFEGNISKIDGFRHKN